MPKLLPIASPAKKARLRARRRATLLICGPDSRRPGGRLFGALCELADRFLQRRGDPGANRLGTVLFYAAFHSARAAEADDFRLSLRSSLEMLSELDPLETMESRPTVDPYDPRLSAPLSGPRPGRPTPVPYPIFAGDHVAFPRSSP